MKTIQRLGSRKIKTCQAPVIFIKDVATGLLGSFLSAISGAALYKKSSFLLDCLGKQVFPNFIDIKEKPHILKGIGSAPYDLEGMQTRNNDLVKSGILTTYLLNSYSARKLHMKPTGHAGGVRNLEISSQYKFSDNDLIKKMNKGLIITELMGHGTNIVTGDYSRGAVGFWVENGEILYPVHEITVAGNLKDMFANIVAISNELDVRSNIRTGSILLDQMTIAGN